MRWTDLTGRRWWSTHHTRPDDIIAAYRDADIPHETHRVDVGGVDCWIVCSPDEWEAE